jgi:hypothetical protein
VESLLGKLALNQKMLLELDVALPSGSELPRTVKFEEQPEHTMTAAESEFKHDHAAVPDSESPNSADACSAAAASSGETSEHTSATSLIEESTVTGSSAELTSSSNRTVWGLRLATRAGRLLRWSAKHCKRQLRDLSSSATSTLNFHLFYKLSAAVSCSVHALKVLTAIWLQRITLLSALTEYVRIHTHVVIDAAAARRGSDCCCCCARFGCAAQAAWKEKQG